MSIYDRDYMREPRRTIHTSMSSAAGGIPATIALLLVNLGVFIGWQMSGMASGWAQHFLAQKTLVFEHFYIHTLLTSAISHISFSHLFYNMIGLFFFGSMVEQYYGSRNLVALYVIAGIIATLCHVLFFDAAVLGASGAVFAILVVAAFLRPHTTVLLFFIVPLPLYVIAIGYVALDLFAVIRPSVGDNVARFAHLGGAAIGALFYLRDLRPFTFDGKWRNPFGAPGSRRSGSSSAGPFAAPGDPPINDGLDADSRARLDGILSQISREGINSVSDDDREFLNNISKRIR
jgi:membrane associated rhomboid family serine protease